MVRDSDCYGLIRGLCCERSLELAALGAGLVPVGKSSCSTALTPATTATTALTPATTATATLAAGATALTPGAAALTATLLEPHGIHPCS